MPINQQTIEKAAGLVAAGKLSLEEIGLKCGVARRTLTGWKTQKDFQELVRTAKDAWRGKARTGGPNDADRRLSDYKNLRFRIFKAVESRAADPDHAHIPGHDTGLVSVKYKMQASVDANGNKISTAVPEYEIDSGTVACLLSIDRQAAEDTGQWKTKREIAITVDKGPSQITLDKYANFDNDDLRTYIALTNKLIGKPE
jgi:hypothetical protein